MANFKQFLAHNIMKKVDVCGYSFSHLTSILLLHTLQKAEVIVWIFKTMNSY